MTKKPTGLDSIAPPPPRAKPSAALDAPTEGAKEQFNTRISAEKAIFVRVLAAKTGRKPGELVEEAIALLEKEYGKT